MPQALATVHAEPPLPVPPAEPSSRHGTSRAAAFVAVVLAIFFAPALGPDQFIARDTGRMHGPMKQWIADELAQGRVPQWNPYSGLGQPVIANGIDAVQHPFTLLLAALPAGAALKAWILLSFAAAAAGAFAWVRLLGVRPIAAAVGAFAFALSGPFVSSSDNVTYLTTYAAIPLVLAATHRFLETRTPGRLALVALASYLCAAAGDPQGWAIVVGLLPLYGVVCARRGERRRNLARGIVAAGVSGLAAAPVILPILLWVPHALRAHGLGAAELTRWNLHPNRLFELGLPDLFRGEVGASVSPAFVAFCDHADGLPWFLSLYLGASVLGLAGLAAARENRARVLCAAAVAFAWAALGSHAGFGQLAAALPLLRSFRYWEKLAVWVALLVAAAAAIGFDALLARPGRRFPAVAAWAGFTALALAALAAVAPGTMTRLTGGTPRAALALATNFSRAALHAGLVLVLLGAMAAAVRRPALARVAPLLLAAIVAADLFGANAGAYVLGPPHDHAVPPLARAAANRVAVLTPFLSREDRWPELGWIASTWAWARRALEASWNVPLRIRTQEDYVALQEARWAQLWGELGEGPAASHLGLFGFGLVLVPGDIQLAAKVGATAPYHALEADPELPAWLVELPHRPRVYVAEEVAAVDAEGAHAFAAAGGAPGKTVIEGPVPRGVVAAHGTARLVDDAAGRTVVEAISDGPALLVLNDAWAPGWTAELDGHPAEILRANWLARGVWTPAGTHRITFAYRTPGLDVGWGIALACGIALGVWGIARARRRIAPPT
jgi:hypothetical protein